MSPPHRSPSPRLHARIGLSVGIAVVALCLSALTAGAGTVARLSVQGSVSKPTNITHAGDDRVFVTEQRGTILILKDSGISSDPFLDIQDIVRDTGPEQGLLSLAFHPNYAHNGYFFISYTAESPSGYNVISRFRVSAEDPDRADRDSEKILLTQKQPQANHNGGQLAFSPYDGYLYIGIGDGGGGGDSSCWAQRPDGPFEEGPPLEDNDLLGKLLRIDVDTGADSQPYHSIPEDNPYATQGPYGEEVWAIGLRNPWRFSFDRFTGDLFIGDVGQNVWEEINFRPYTSTGKENYGWKVMEGDSCFDPDPIDSDCPETTPSCFDPAFTAPVHVYEHENGFCSVTGGFVYRGTEISDLHGQYVFSDWCVNTMQLLKPIGGDWLPQTDDTITTGFGNVTTFGEDAAGELYVGFNDGTGSTGRIYKMVCDGCTIDRDLDDVEDSIDNCPGVPNTDQDDSDEDDFGDACDACPETTNDPEQDTNENGQLELCECGNGSTEGLALPGDANQDDLVDGADYTIWADHLGEDEELDFPDGDFNCDGLIDGSDYTIWADNFGLEASEGGGACASSASVGVGVAVGTVNPGQAVEDGSGGATVKIRARCGLGFEVVLVLLPIFAALRSRRR